MDDLFLIYIHEIGTNHNGEHIYEFIFSDTTEDVDGEYWDKFPASGSPEPPKTSFIKAVGTLTTDMKFILIQDSDMLAVWDAVDGVIALAFEDTMDYDEYPTTRLFFNFGEKFNVVKEKLYGYDKILKFEGDE